MILVQLLKVLPAASTFKIYDENRPVLEGQIARYDKSLMFKDVKDDLLFQRTYGSFHVELVDKVDDIWIINVR